MFSSVSTQAASWLSHWGTSSPFCGEARDLRKRFRVLAFRSAWAPRVSVGSVERCGDAGAWQARPSAWEELMGLGSLLSHVVGPVETGRVETVTDWGSALQFGPAL